MKYYFIIFSDNWADEIDLESCWACTEEEWNKQLTSFTNDSFPHTWHVGSNEEIEYKTKEDLISHFTVKEISESECEVMRRIMGKSGIGRFPEFW